MLCVVSLFVFAELHIVSSFQIKTVYIAWGLGLHHLLNKVLPMEQLLRTCWNTNQYLTGGPDSKKAFLLEETSKVHVHRISQLMNSDYAWAVIAMVALLSGDSDALGSWAEGCPCHPLTDIEQIVSFREKKKAKAEAKECVFKCCRAPELACGHGLKHVVVRLVSHKALFTQYMSKAPPGKRAELNSSWESACSKLFGSTVILSKILALF